MASSSKCIRGSSSKNNNSSMSLTRVLVIVATLSVVALALTGSAASAALAASTIPPSACPNNEVPTCSDFGPASGVNLYAGLTYTHPSIAACVTARCICTSYPDFDSTTPVSSMYCSGSLATEKEYGATTCNVFGYCYSDFFRCVDNAALAMYSAGTAAIFTPEYDLAEFIIANGNTVGGNYATTSLFASCAQATCNAAASRQPCGLKSCQPKMDHICNATIEGPPAPHVQMLCTSPCVASLLLMALTFISFLYFLVCLCACPAPVPKKKKAPVKKDTDDDEDQ